MIDPVQIGQYAAMAVGIASVLAAALEKITGITPLDADDIHLPAIKRAIAKATQALGAIGFHPKR